MADFQDGVWTFEAGEVELTVFEDYVDLDMHDDSQKDDLPNRKARLTLSRNDASILADKILRATWEEA